ncbi:hypothetical protein GCM10010116_54730 [Microbispora rosea subsp. aerata]|nr:hypothetical protein GCM10010116_54730 [Microbispora rosea subsp. aerata]GIH57625.1 hypothetical protein Mro02_45390 [Microbispora rosea subsp. aerata]GLJ86803.1 hypothetical protein GCM10017588_55440 [Microbispora rosea subsp. aerata]
MIFVVEIVFRKNANQFSDDVERRSDAYWKRMADRGVLLGGGPWRDGTGRMLVCEAADQAELFQVLNGDPLTGSHVVSRMRVRKWNPVLGHGLLSGAGRRSGRDATLTSLSDERPGAAEKGARTRRSRIFFGGADGAGRQRPGSEALTEALTPHEERIARMMIDGMTNRKIAECLSVSTRAVELHITRIYRKLAIKRRAQLAIALAQQPNAA